MKDKILEILKDPMSDELKSRFIIQVFNDSVIEKMEELAEKKQTQGFAEVMSLYVTL